METIEDLIAAAIEREPEFVTDNPYASMSHPNARRLALVKAWEMLTVECRQVVSHVGVPALFCDKGVWSPVEGESHNPYVGTAHEGCHGTGRVPAPPPSTFPEAWQEARLRAVAEVLGIEESNITGSWYIRVTDSVQSGYNDLGEAIRAALYRWTDYGKET